MASTTVAVRLSDELVSELQKVAGAQNKKVSDIVRELIASGLESNRAGGGIDAGDDLSKRLDRLEAAGLKAVKAVLKAQFLANMSASFAVDVARLMSAGTQRSTEEEQEFMAQMDSWAEAFANGELQKD